MKTGTSKLQHSEALVKERELLDLPVSSRLEDVRGKQNSLVFLNTPSSVRPISGGLRVRPVKFVACRRNFQASEMFAHSSDNSLKLAMCARGRDRGERVGPIGVVDIDTLAITDILVWTSSGIQVQPRSIAGRGTKCTEWT